MFKLFLDPGHGGSDPGAVGNGIREKDITLSIALKIRDILQSEYEEVEIKMVSPNYKNKRTFLARMTNNRIS